MGVFRPGSESLVLLLWADGVVGAILLVLLVTTAVARHLVLPQRFYLLCALLGFLAWLGFLAASGEIFSGTSQRLWAVASMFLIAWLPYILLAEVAALCWLGTHRPWSELLVTAVLLAGVLMRYPGILGKFLVR